MDLEMKTIENHEKCRGLRCEMTLEDGSKKSGTVCDTTSVSAFILFDDGRRQQVLWSRIGFQTA